jgi:hypothetical protein
MLEPGATLAAPSPGPSRAPTTLEGTLTAEGPLEAGRYLTSTFDPPVSFAVGPGWTVSTELPHYLLLSNTAAPGRGIEIVDVVGVIDPDGEGRTPAGIALDREDTLDCLVASIVSHPWVRVTRPPVSQQLGAVSGWSFDLALELPDDSPWAGAPYAPMFNLSQEAGPIDRLAMSPHPQRVVILRTMDERAPYLLLTAFGEDEAGFEAFTPFAQQVIDSIQVDTSTIRTELLPA